MMTRSVTWRWMLLPMGLVAGCDRMGGGKTDQMAACTMAPSAAGAAAPGATAPGAGQTPAPVDEAQITQRSVSTIVEQMSFQLCTARINRWVDDEYYRQEMTALRKASFAALGVGTSDESSIPSRRKPDPRPDTEPEETNAL